MKKITRSRSPLTTTMKNKAPRTQTLAAIAFLAFAGQGFATAYTWNQSAGGTYSWDAAANWLPNSGFPDNSADIANITNDIFGAITINVQDLAGDQFVDLGTVTIGDGQTAGASAFTLAAVALNSLQIAAGGAINSQNGANVIAAPIVLAGAATISHTSGYSYTAYRNDSLGSLTLSSTATINNGGLLLTLGGSGQMSVAGVISGTGGLTKTGLGQITLTGANTFTGPVTVNQGLLNFTDKSLG